MDRSLRGVVLRALDFVAARGPLKPLGNAIRWGFVYYLELHRDMAFIRAAGMAYATVVALVPGLAVVLFVLQATGVSAEQDGAEGVVLDRLFGAVPGLADTLVGLLSGVDLRGLGAVALIGLLLVASRLYVMVERAYCDVFGVSVSHRPIVLRMLSFYFTITAVPVVIVIALRGSFRVAAGLGVGRASDWAGLALELAVLVAALKLLPATHVRWRAAFAGALTSFVLLEAGRFGLGFYVKWVLEVGSLSAVYGSLAIVPVFLLWVYLVWVFVLLGVEVAQVTQNYATLVERELALADDGPRWPAIDAPLRATCWVAWSFEHGRGPVPLEVLAERTGLDPRDLSPVVDVLADAGILVRTDAGWLLSRPAAAMPLADVMRAWRDRTGGSSPDDPLGAELADALALPGTVADGIARWLPAATPGPVSDGAIRSRGVEVLGE